jgi:hypothetical protein
MDRTSDWGVIAGGLLLAASACGGHMVDETEDSAATPGERRAAQTVRIRIEPILGLSLAPEVYVVVMGASGVTVMQRYTTVAFDKDPTLTLSLDAGSGYRLTLTALTLDPGDAIWCSANFGPFEVASRGSSSYAVFPTCFDETVGGPL